MTPYAGAGGSKEPVADDGAESSCRADRGPGGAAARHAAGRHDTWPARWPPTTATAAAATTAATKSATAGHGHAAAASATAAATRPMEQRGHQARDGDAGADAGRTHAGSNAGDAWPRSSWTTQYAWSGPGAGSAADNAILAAADTCSQVPTIPSTATASPPDTQVQPEPHGCFHKAESQQWRWWRGRRRQLHPCLASWCPTADAGGPGRGSPADAAGPDARPTHAAATATATNDAAAGESDDAAAAATADGPATAAAVPRHPPSAAAQQLWWGSPATVPGSDAAGGPTVPTRHEPWYAGDAAEDAGDAGWHAHRHDALPSPITTADSRAVSKPRPVPSGRSHGNGAKSTHPAPALQPGAGSQRGWQRWEQPWGRAGGRERGVPQCDDAA